MRNQLSGKRLLLSWLLLFCWHSLSAQISLVKRKQLLIGSWSWCQSIGKLDTTGLCVDSNYGRYNWHYVFATSGKFYESQSGIKSYGTWQLTSAELTLDYDDTPKRKRYPYTNPVIWVNENLFYCVGQEGPKGPLVFSYYRRIKSEKSQNKP